MAGWNTVQATSAWDGTGSPFHHDAEADQFVGPAAASAWASAAPTTKDLAAYVEERIAVVGEVARATCPPAPELQDPIDIGGEPGTLLSWDCGILINIAVTVRNGTGYQFGFFATADSLTAGHLEAMAPAGYEEDPRVTPKVYEALHIARAMEQADRFDLLHNHFDFLPLAWSRLIRTPLLTTIHGFSSAAVLPVYREYDRHAFYVSISDADRDPSLDYVATVYNGIRLADFTFRPNPGEYAVVLGRIHHDKGVHLAIEAATAAGLPLMIAGMVQDVDYFRHHVEPRLDGDRVRFLGPVGPVERDSLLAGALALLHLVTFDEPFGLAMIEAMACGTPVIGMRRGAVPEVVVDGQTGVLVADVAGAVRALRVVAGLDRGRCRTRVEERFTLDTMVRGYLDVYAEVLERWPSRRDRTASDRAEVAR